MGFGRILFLVFLVVPLIEIACFVVIGNAIGLWPTLAGVLLTAVAGSLVLRQQGLAVFRKIQAATARGEVPGRALADAACIGAGGLMLLLPGYFSDLIGILLLLPPVRSAIFAFLKRRVRVVTSPSGHRPGAGGPQGTIDLDAGDWRER